MGRVGSKSIIMIIKQIENIVLFVSYVSYYEVVLLFILIDLCVRAVIDAAYLVREVGGVGKNMGRVGKRNGASW